MEGLWRTRPVDVPVVPPWRLLSRLLGVDLVARYRWIVGVDWCIGTLSWIG